MALRGNQRPTFEHRPTAYSSAGQDAVDLARANGLIADDWQAHVLAGALGETRAGQWVCNEVAVVVGRQNGKGFLIEARELAGIFIFGETLILHSAHQQRTSNDAFLRMKAIVMSNDELSRHVTAVAHSKGEEGITFNIGGRIARLRYMARTGGAGRGFSKADCVILDEAMILDNPPIAALLPTMATQPNWQVWYTASQGDRKLPTESRVLGQIRRRGYRRERGLYFAEWAAHLRHGKLNGQDCVANGRGDYKHPLDIRGDPATWAKCNPAMGTRIPEDFLRKMIIGGGMSTWDSDREFLGVGDYPADDGWGVIGEQLWESLVDTQSKRDGGFAVGIDVSWDQMSASVSMAGKRPDGMWHWEVIKVADGTAWVPGFLKALPAMGKKPVVYTVDGRCPILEDIRKAVGERYVYSPRPTEWSSWCAKMLQILTETQDVRHIGQPSLTNALKVVERKEYQQGAFVWKREEPQGNVTPWLALTLAVGGVLVKGTKEKRRPLVAAS